MLFCPRLRFLVLFLLLAAGRAGAEPMPARRVLKLTLASAVQAGLSANFAIAGQRLGPQIAEENVRVAQGRFDPLFTIAEEHADTTEDDVFRNNLVLQTRRNSRLDNLSSGITGVTAWGTRYEVTYGGLARTATGQLLDDIYTSEGTVRLTQPLLRGAGPTANLAALRIARSQARSSEWELRQRIIDTITTIDFVYNDLYLRVQEVEVAERSRELARQLFKDNQARVEIGVKSPIDVSQARAEVAKREEAVLIARRRVLGNENELKRLLTRDLIELLEVRVEIEPRPALEFRRDVRSGIADALQLRPDHRLALLELERRQITVALRKNDRLPRLDLTSSLSLLGLDSDFGRSVSRIGERDRTEWSAGVIFSIPLGNRAARGSYNQASLAAAQQLIALSELEQRIITAVDNAIGEIETARERIRSNAEFVRFSREALAAGQDRLRAGTGTTFEVLELQDKLAQAEFAELGSRADYYKAIGEYYRQTGTALRVYRIELE